MKPLTPLYTLGVWLVEHFGPPADPAQDAADRQREIVEMANAVAEIVLIRLAPPPLTPVPPPPPPVPPTFEESLSRIVDEIHADVAGATLQSVHDRVVKALARLRPDAVLADLRLLAAQEMKRKGIV